jgi:hypothetical protein
MELCALIKIGNVMVDRAAAVVEAYTIARQLAAKPFSSSDFGYESVVEAFDGVDLLEVLEPGMPKHMNACFSLKVMSKLNPDLSLYDYYLPEEELSEYLES